MSESSTQTPAPSSGPPSPVIRHLCILLALCGILLFWNLGALGLTDRDEGRNAEAGQIQRQRLEAIGNLASGIAHDLNNTLAPLTLGLQLLRFHLQTLAPGFQRLIGLEIQLVTAHGERERHFFGIGTEFLRVEHRFCQRCG